MRAKALLNDWKPHDLSQPATHDPACFGGKSAQLAGLAARGAPAPAGFAIPVSALLDWQAPIRSQIEAEVARLGPGTEADVSARIADLFQSTPLDRQLRDRISASCQATLPAGEATLVAVRSSAEGEDAAKASFAGQFESFLGISGLDQIGLAIRRVWASLYSPRAIRYRHEAGRPALASPMGVTVLEMVDAAASGVAFSVDAVSGKTDRIIIEATLGLAETLVQGIVSPDRLVIDKAELRLMSVDVGRKSLTCELDWKGGTRTSRTPVDLQGQPSLAPKEAEALAQIIRRLDDQMGHPIDIEWAIGRDGRLRLLQVRPISSPMTPPPLVCWRRDACLPDHL